MEMGKERNEFLHFVQSSKGFDNNAKLRLLVFGAELKPSTHVAIKITSENSEEKEHFENHLRKAGVKYSISRPKSFEEIESVKGSVVKWRIAGTWYGYDLFQDEKASRLFKRYKGLIRQGKLYQADLAGGELYGYPRCCAEQFARERDKRWLASNYTCYEFYKRAHDCDRAFPFIMHTPCSPSCKETKRLNQKYNKTVKSLAPKFYRAYSTELRFNSRLLVGSYSDVYWEEIDGKTSIWPIKDGFEYALICLTPIKKKYFLLAWLSKDYYEKGVILEAKVKVKYDYADLSRVRVAGILPDLYHERRLPALGGKNEIPGF